MKVAIASCFFHHNYGSMLQAYATQEAIKKLDNEVSTINCLSPITYMTQSKTRYYIKKIANGDIVKTKIRNKLSSIRLRKYPEIVEGIKIRDKKFEDFKNKFFTLSELNKTRKELTNCTKKFDTVVVGSDMLWHPINVEHDYYTLTFVPDEVKKISYATSIGTPSLTPKEIPVYQSFLKRFSSISVREKSGVELINGLNIGKQAQLVLDPTLLFDAQGWQELIEDVPVTSGPYILCYFLGVNKDHREFAKELSRDTGYKIVALQHLDEFVEADVSFGDEKPFNVDPAELVNLIRHAEYVCTDSFHGTCFSIINHRKFFTMNRFMDDNTQSTNTRIDSLLSNLGLENRRVNSQTYDIKSLAESSVDYDTADRILSSMREDSINYLKSAIEG